MKRKNLRKTAAIAAAVTFTTVSASAYAATGTYDSGISFFQNGSIFFRPQQGMMQGGMKQMPQQGMMQNGMEQMPQQGMIQGGMEQMPQQGMMQGGINQIPGMGDDGIMNWAVAGMTPQQSGMPDEMNGQMPQQNGMPGEMNGQVPQQNGMSGEMNGQMPQQNGMPGEMNGQMPQQNRMSGEMNGRMPQQDGMPGEMNRQIPTAPEAPAENTAPPAASAKPTAEPVVIAEPTEEAAVETEAPAEEATAEPTEAPTEAAEGSGETMTGEETEGYVVTFECDEHVSVTVYDTKDVTSGGTENVISAYARNNTTGEIDTSGSGQVNFVVVADDGYTATATIDEAYTGNYNKFNQDPNSSGDINCYRITKISGDLTVTIKATASVEEGVGDGVIHLNGTSIDAAGVAGAVVSGSTLTLTASDEAYQIEGALDDGNIVIAKNAGDVTLEFIGNTSVSSSSAAAISAKSGSNLILAADSGVKASFSSESKKAIDGSGDIVINGDGEIEAITTSQKNAIGGDTVTITGSGTTTVNSQKHGIEGASAVVITGDPTINVTSYGDGIRSDSAPEIANDGTIAASVGVTGGTVTIEGGNINIKTTSFVDESTDEDGNVTSETKYGDGIQADTLFTMNGGSVTIDAGGEGIQAGFSQLDLMDASDYSAYKTALDAYNGCIVINGGSINAKSGEDGIKATKDIVINDGYVTVKSTLDGIQTGDETDDEKYTVNGTLTINGGTFNITSGGGNTGKMNPTLSESMKGIKSNYQLAINGGSFTIKSRDDAVHCDNRIDITGGTLNINSDDDGMHADAYLYISDSANVNVLSSYEGIEAAEIYISGGETRVVATDDGVNAAGDNPNGTTTTSANRSGFGGMNSTSTYGYIKISGGFLYIEAEGDGFDSNGSALITGGTVLVNGPTGGGNGVFDMGDNGSSLTITGGTVIGAGTSDMAVTPTATTGSQAYVVTTLSSQQAGKAFRLASGSNNIATYIPSKAYSWVFVSTPDIKSGSDYTLSYGGSASGIVTGNAAGTRGIVTNGSYSGGSQTTLTAVTSGGANGMGNQMPGGMGGNQQPGNIGGQPGGNMGGMR